MTDNSLKQMLPVYLESQGIDIRRKFTCLNPSHSDGTPSMAYDRRRNKCHCFSCGADADLFNLIEWDQGVSFSEAKKIAEGMYGCGDEPKPEYRKRISSHRHQKEDKTAPLSVRDSVYRTMRDLCPLTDGDVTYLTKVRGIPEEEAKKRYFRPVTDDAGRALVTRRLRKITGYGTDVIKYVPGFFVKAGRLDYVTESGIGILIYDENGNVPAVQIRRDTAEKGNRYCWFSSKYYMDKPGYDGGATPGSPKDVLIPKNPKKSVCITEGRFKSEVLASYRNISVSVQGVSSWRGIDRVLKNLTDRYGIRTAYLMFDADILGNYQLLRSLRDMTKAIHESLPDLKLTAGLWPIEYGKGVDDCILSGNMERIRYVNADLMLEVCEKTYRDNPGISRECLQKVNEGIFFRNLPKAA